MGWVPSALSASLRETLQRIWRSRGLGRDGPASQPKQARAELSGPGVGAHLGATQAVAPLFGTLRGLQNATRPPLGSPPPGPKGVNPRGVDP